MPDACRRWRLCRRSRRASGRHLYGTWRRPRAFLLWVQHPPLSTSWHGRGTCRRHGDGDAAGYGPPICRGSRVPRVRHPSDRERLLPLQRTFPLGFLAGHFPLCGFSRSEANPPSRSLKRQEVKACASEIITNRRRRTLRPRAERGRTTAGAKRTYLQRRAKSGYPAPRAGRLDVSDAQNRPVLLVEGPASRGCST